MAEQVSAPYTELADHPAAQRPTEDDPHKTTNDVRLPDITNGRGWVPWSRREEVVSFADNDVPRSVPSSDKQTETPKLIKGVSKLDLDDRSSAATQCESVVLSQHADDLHLRLDLENPYEGCSLLSLSKQDQAAHQDQNTTLVGVAYQITQLGKLDTVEETLGVGLELSFLFKVSEEEDLRVYREKAGEELAGAGGWGEINPLLKKPLPGFKILSAVEEPEIISETIVAVRECVETRALFGGCQRGEDEDAEDTKGFYVQLYGKYRTTTRQVMDLQSFPFSRLFMRLIFVNTESTKKYSEQFLRV